MFREKYTILFYISNSPKWMLQRENRTNQLPFSEKINMIQRCFFVLFVVKLLNGTKEATLLL